MATIVNTNDLSYVRNNTGKMDLSYKGYLFNQKTNLVREGKNRCLFRCRNRGKCYSSISLKTDLIDGFNQVVEPFTIVAMKVDHASTCIKSLPSELRAKDILHEIKELTAKDPLRPAQQIFEAAQAFYLSSNDSDVDALQDYNDVIIQKPGSSR